MPREVQVMITTIVSAWLMTYIAMLTATWSPRAPAARHFQYQYEHVPGTGPRWRWVCPTCGREGEWMLSREQAMADTKKSHGWGTCSRWRRTSSRKSGQAVSD